MFPRILLFAGLAATLVVAAQASARPRRFVRPTPQPVVLESPPTPVAQEPLKQVAYAVADLVIPIPTQANLDVEPLPSKSVLTKPKASTVAAKPTAVMLPGILQANLNQPAANATVEDRLIELITSHIAPSSWSSQGGRGTIQYFPLGHALVVNQTLEVQEEILALVQSLRRLQSVQVALEVRVIQVCPQALERAQKELRLACRQPTDLSEGEKSLEEIRKGQVAVGSFVNRVPPFWPIPGRVVRFPSPQIKPENWIVSPKDQGWTSLLSAEQATRLCKIVQADPSSTLLQSPKITMFNGQKAVLEVTEQKCFTTGLEIGADECGLRITPKHETVTNGLRLGLMPVLSLSVDRQAVNVEMHGYWSQSAGPPGLVSVPLTQKNKQEERRVLQQPKFNQVFVHQKVSSIPNGSAFLINAGVVGVEVPCDDWCSWLSEICFGQKTTTSEDRCVLFLVTPRIIVLEQEEQIFLGVQPPIPRP